MFEWFCALTDDCNGLCILTDDWNDINGAHGRRPSLVRAALQRRRVVDDLCGARAIRGPGTWRRPAAGEDAGRYVSGFSSAAAFGVEIWFWPARQNSCSPRVKSPGLSERLHSGTSTPRTDSSPPVTNTDRPSRLDYPSTSSTAVGDVRRHLPRPDRLDAVGDAAPATPRAAQVGGHMRERCACAALTVDRRYFSVWGKASPPSTRSADLSES